MKLIKMERIGTILIVLFTLILSNLYLSTDMGLFRMVGANNASVMEQMKVIYFSLIFFIIIEMLFKVQYNDNFFYAKAISSYILVFSVPMLFYTFKNMFGVMNMFMYILLIFLAALLCQSFSCKILLDEQIGTLKGKLISILSILLLGIILVYFSYNPLSTPIFMAG
ncbi:DUF6512 family protein [Anaerofustis stercorihominis]|uniref:Uncharacterized protein n=1 Tax=Anaerofustis stercorihominis TaxID=214853 RepID=A0A3E3E255_9FIRM|nr:DUF6512 family protein [Anaerofustis stercorihominis]RGD75627.1 hypothetical protein DW687_04700 [Anaerofustis stercorihominis]